MGDAIDARQGNGHGARTRAPRQLRKRDIGEGAPDCSIHPLPRMSDTAVRFEPTRAVLAAAFRDRERPLERIEDLRGRDAGGGPCELIAAVTAASGCHESAALQLLQ